MKIGIIDYGAGNLRSVCNAFEAIGHEPVLIADSRGVDDVGVFVLPGVGAFGKGMAGLRERGLDAALDRRVRRDGCPMLGICLGLQLLATRSFELGEHEGLGWIAADVKRLEPDGNLRVPHIGWNDVAGRGRLFEGITSAASCFYFVHSYHLVPVDESVVAGRTAYGLSFASAIETGNVLAVQFHPEKSHKHGLTVLRNFAVFAEKC